MGLFGPGLDRNGWDKGSASNLEQKAEKRKKKLEKQEKKVKKLSAPVLPWLFRAFRVITIAGTLAMCIVEFNACRMSAMFNENVDFIGRLSYTAFVMWSVMGSVWIISTIAILRNIVQGKMSEEETEKEDGYKLNLKIALAVWIVLFVCFLAFWIF